MDDILLPNEILEHIIYKSNNKTKYNISITSKYLNNIMKYIYEKQIIILPNEVLYLILYYINDNDTEYNLYNTSKNLRNIMDYIISKKGSYNYIIKRSKKFKIFNINNIIDDILTYIIFEKNITRYSNIFYEINKIILELIGDKKMTSYDNYLFNLIEKIGSYNVYKRNDILPYLNLLFNCPLHKTNNDIYACDIIYSDEINYIYNRPYKISDNIKYIGRENSISNDNKSYFQHNTSNYGIKYLSIGKSKYLISDKNKYINSELYSNLFTIKINYNIINDNKHIYKKINELLSIKKLLIKKLKK